MMERNEIALFIALLLAILDDCFSFVIDGQLSKNCTQFLLNKLRLNKTFRLQFLSEDELYFID